MSAAATRAGSFVSGSDKASVAPRLTRRDTIPEHEAKIEEHFQDLQDVPCMPWAADTPGQTAYPSLSSLQESPAAQSDSAPLPEGWKVHIHPNGSIYYENADYKLTSNFDLRRTPREHEYFLDKLRSSPAYDEREDHWEANLTRRDDTNGYIWVDHAARAASELNQHPVAFAADMRREDIGARLKRLERYWTYVQGHPNHVRAVPAEAWQDAHDALSWCYADRLLFKHTNATFSKDDSKDLLEMLDRLKDGSSPLRNWFIASVLRAISSDRQGTHYGQHDAPKFRQREADDMVAGYDALSAPMKCAYYVLGGAVFLGIPHTYFRRIQDVDRTRFRDGVNTMRWKAFLRALLKEWGDSNLLATVLISATVAFLAVPGLEDYSRMLGLFSVLLAIGSVLVGMFFVWHHQPRAESSADVGLNYFTHAKHFTDSSVPLAFILSVPVVLLLWSFLCFITAILIYAFHGTQQRTDGTFARFSRATSPTTLAMFSLVLACAFLAWMFMSRVWTCRHQPAKDVPAMIVSPAHDGLSWISRTSRLCRGLFVSCCWGEPRLPTHIDDDFTPTNRPKPSLLTPKQDRPLWISPPQPLVASPDEIDAHVLYRTPEAQLALEPQSQRARLSDESLHLHELFGDGAYDRPEDLKLFVAGRAPADEKHSHRRKPKQFAVGKTHQKDRPGRPAISAIQWVQKAKAKAEEHHRAGKAAENSEAGTSMLGEGTYGSAASTFPPAHRLVRSASFPDFRDGALLIGVIGTAHALPETNRALRPDQRRYTAVKAKRQSVPIPVAASHMPPAKARALSLDDASAAMPPGPPRLPPLNMLGLDAIPPPLASPTLHRASSDPDISQSWKQDVFGPVHRTRGRDRDSPRSSPSVPAHDSQATRASPHPSNITTSAAAGVTRSMNPFDGTKSNFDKINELAAAPDYV